MAKIEAREAVEWQERAEKAEQARDEWKAAHDNMLKMYNQAMTQGMPDIHENLIQAEKDLNEYRARYEEAVQDLVKFKDREMRAAELLRVPVGNNGYVLWVGTDYNVWSHQRDQWLKDAGFGK